MIGYANSQDTVIDFSDTSYSEAVHAGVETNLNVHPNWGSHNSWSASSNNNSIILASTNWKRAVYQLPFSGADGDVLSVTIRVKLGNDDQAFLNPENFLLISLSTISDYTVGPAITDREGVVIQSTNAADNELILNGGGMANFTNKPTISMADKSTYEITFELYIKENAANSYIKARITNIGSGETSETETSAQGINDGVYNAVTSSGVYLLLYSYNPFQGSVGVDYYINYIDIPGTITISKSTTGVLNTQKFNNFDFSLFPNPVKNELNINSKEKINSIEIYNVLGKKVLTSKNVSKNIDISSLSKSVYLVKVFTDKGISTKKLVKN